MPLTPRHQLILFVIVTSMSSASLSHDLDWDIEIRQFSAVSSVGASVQRSATALAPSSDVFIVSSAIMSESVPLRSSVAQTFAPSSSIESFPQTSAAPTSAAPEPTSIQQQTSDQVPSQTPAASGNTGGGAITSQGSPFPPSSAPQVSSAPDNPEATSVNNGDNGSPNQGSPTTSARGSQSTGGGLVNGLGTTRSGGTLIVATTDASGRTTTLRGADASSATRAVRTYTSALLATSQRPLTYRSTRIVDGSTSVGDFVTSRPVTVTTRVATATNEAELNGSNMSSSGGLDASDKKIVGGVVGGIGGALLLGFIIIALLRYRKRKNRRLNDDDYDDNDYNAQENKRISRGSTQILGDGLERYHNPASPTTAPPMSVNTSSNF